MLHGAAFPPVVVFGEGGEYWLADGYHRWHAAGIAGLQTIAADVRPGGQREAILHSMLVAIRRPCPALSMTPTLRGSAVICASWSRR
jgi:hypothetical protein